MESEGYACNKCQKRPTKTPKETYKSTKRDLQMESEGARYFMHPPLLVSDDFLLKILRSQCTDYAMSLGHASL